MSKVVTFDHPLIQHKTTMLRQTSTTNKEFRELVEEITTLMCYESLRDLPLKEIEIETPIKKTTQKIIAGKDLAVVPILRAGLGMVNGLLRLVPTAKVGHIGMYRDEETMQPCEYYCKLPDDIEHRLVVVVDPMLATGGSAIDAVGQIKSYGAKNIKFLCLIAAPEGVNALSKAHPDIEIYCANVDEGLNDKCYIVPGLGDAGDRIFGTK